MKNYEVLLNCRLGIIVNSESEEAAFSTVKDELFKIHDGMAIIELDHVQEFVPNGKSNGEE